MRTLFKECITTYENHCANKNKLSEPEPLTYITFGPIKLRAQRINQFSPSRDAKSKFSKSRNHNDSFFELDLSVWVSEWRSDLLDKNEE